MKKRQFSNDCQRHQRQDDDDNNILKNNFKENDDEKQNSSSSCLSVDQVSYEFREPYITTGYRCPNSSALKCIRSLLNFDNNEVLNFWTHFLPFLFVCYQLVRFCQVYDVRRDEFVWPLFIYLCTIGFYLSMSAAAHAFNCMSPIARHLCFSIDYMSISIYGLGSAISYKAYLLKLVSKDEEYVFNKKSFHHS